MAAKRKTAHVVMDLVHGVMRCEHCKDEFPMPLGAIDFVCKVATAFTNVHRLCCPDSEGGLTMVAGQYRPSRA